MSAREKIAYLKGLIDGQNLTADSPDKAKFYTALVDALDSLAVAIEDHEEVHEELNAYLEQTKMSRTLKMSLTSSTRMRMMTSAAITITTMMTTGKTARILTKRNTSR